MRVATIHCYAPGAAERLKEIMRDFGELQSVIHYNNGTQFSFGLAAGVDLDLLDYVLDHDPIVGNSYRGKVTG